MRKILLMIMAYVTFVNVIEAEEININLVEKDMVFTYYDAGGDWYFGASDETGKYSLHLDYLSGASGRYGTFTDADLDNTYSYIRHTNGDGTDADEYLIQEGSTFTIGIQNARIVITGRLCCSDGNIYVISGNFPVPDPVIYNVECDKITLVEYYEEDNDWYVRFKNDRYKVTLDLKSKDGGFNGTYTEADALEEGRCYISDLEEDMDIPFVTFTVTMKQSEDVADPIKGCEITGTATVATGDIYKFHMLQNAPIKPKKAVEVDVDVKTSEWPTERLSGRSSYYELTEKADAAKTWTLGVYDLTGESTEEHLEEEMTYCVNTATNDTLMMDNGRVTQVFDKENMRIDVKAELVMRDSVQYNISFSVPVAVKAEKSYTFTNLWLDSSLAEYGSLILNAYTDSCDMELNISEAEFPGTYDDSNATASVNVYDMDGNSTFVNGLTILEAVASLAADGSPVLRERFLGEDMNIYNIDASFVVPEITDTLDIFLEEAFMDDMTPYDGGFSISVSGDKNYGAYICVNSGNKVVGHYSFDALDSTSFISITDDSGTSNTLKFYSGDFDVTYNGDYITLIGNFQIGSHYVRLRIETDDVLLDGISDVHGNHLSTDTSTYNLAGQRVNNNAKGIIIKDGRKYIKR